MATFMDDIKANATAIAADVAADAITDHAQNTDTGTSGADFTVKKNATTGKIKISAAAGAADKTLTVTNAPLTDNRTITYPDATGTVALAANMHTQGTDAGTTGKQFMVASGSVVGRIRVEATYGGSDKELILTNAVLTGDRTATFQNASGVVALTSDLLLKETRDIPMSFETNEVMTMKVYFPYKVTVNKIRGIVTKAIAASDNGTITCGNSTGASTSGVVTATASDALAVEYSVIPSDNNVVEADSYYYLTTAKSTAGGRVLVTLEVTRTA